MSFETLDTILRGTDLDALVVDRGLEKDEPVPRSLAHLRAPFDRELSVVVRRACDADSLHLAIGVYPGAP